MKYLVWLFGAMIILAAGCSGKPGDPRLLEISEKVSDSPKEMLARLDSINVGSLGEADRNFHALMRIKAQDKAFIRHTSDSVILRVIDYYSRHKGSGLYPEALYYGGRIYSDLGDSPTALRYFQDALDALPKDKNDGFRATILSQTGRLLNALRLYTDGASYVKQAVKLQTISCDSVKLMHNLRLLGAIYMHSESYDSADSCFKVSYDIAKSVCHSDTLVISMYLAATKLYRDEINASLQNIRKVLKKIPARWEDMIYSYASQIYLKAGMHDSAYLYATKLIKDENIDYQRIGYAVLLNPSLVSYSSSDSILSYTQKYRAVIDAYLTRHDAQQADIQTSLYNYQIHDRNRKKAEDVRSIYMYVAGIALILVLVLCVGLLYLRQRRMRLQLSYLNALDNIGRLEHSLSMTEEKLKKTEKTIEELEAKKLEVEKRLRQGEELTEVQDEKNEDNQIAENVNEEDRLREQLKEKLLRLQKAGDAKKNDPKKILTPSVYSQLKENIDNGTWLQEDDDVWQKIENTVLQLSPDFKTNLTLLLGGKIKSDVYRMSLLVRCGFGPTAVGALLGRSKGAISSRRSYICVKVFGDNFGGKVMNDIISML